MEQTRAGDTPDSLIHRFAPVVRFSQGERFYPMNVEDYVMACKGLYRGKKLVFDFKDIKTPAERIACFVAPKKYEEEHKERAQPVGKRPASSPSPEDTKPYNLHLIERKPFHQDPEKMLLTLIMALLAATIIFGVNWMAVNLTAFHLDVFDWLKMLALMALIVFYPVINADSKVHLAIVLNLFGLLFFGTSFAVGFGILGIVLLVGFGLVFLTFRRIFKEPPVKPAKLIRGHIFNLVLVTTIATAIGMLARAIDLVAANTALVLGLTVGVFYATLWVSQIKMDIPKNRKAIWLLSGTCIAIAIFTALHFWFIQAGRPDLMTEGETVLTTVALAAMGLLWYALDPLPVTRRALPETEEEKNKRLELNKSKKRSQSERRSRPEGLAESKNTGRQRKKVFGWDGRVLSFIIGAFVLSTVASWYFTKYPPTAFNEVITGLIVYLLISTFNLAVSVGILGTSAISYLLDVNSGMDNSDADEAEKIYKAILEKYRGSGVSPYTCYASCFTQEDWTILLYNYFYAFNDWRSTANGMNNHEGDWEAVAVFLKEKKPFGVAYSQHFNGEFRYWDDVIRVKDRQGNKTEHPVVYAALGSHANYPEPAILSPSVQFGGSTRKVVSAMEGFVRLFRQKAGIAGQKAQETKMAQDFTKQMKFPSQHQLDKRRPLRGSELLPGALEYAAGDGLRVGFFNETTDTKKEFRNYTPNLPDPIEFDDQYMEPRAPNTLVDWQICPVDSHEPFVKYTGLWGRFVDVEGENGPQGPRWEKPGQQRYRWGGEEELGPSQKYSLSWLHVLLMDICLDKESGPYHRWLSFQEIAREMEYQDQAE